MSARPRVVCIIQARMGSSRLPGKVLARAGGRSLIEHLVARLRRARTLHDVVLATTVAPADDVLAVEAGRLGLVTFRGSEDDVLSRYAGAAARAGADVIVRVTADCPLLDSAEVDRVVGEFLSLRGGPDEVDYATNQAGAVRRIPRGLDVEVFTREALSRAQDEAAEPGDREHVTPYLYRVAGRFRTRITHFPAGDFSAFRLTVDAPEDLELVRRLFAAVGDDASFAAVARYLGEHPELLELNRHISQKSIASEHELRRQRIAGKLLLGRADAGPAIGLGHVARTFALLEAWVECGGRAKLVGAGVSGRLRERMNRGWFQRSLSGDARRLFIAEDEQGPLGMVRLDWRDQDHTCAEVGIALAPERRGQGLSGGVLEALIAEARASGVRRLVARIREGNTASQRAFARAGFEATGSEQVGDIRALRYELEFDGPSDGG